MKTLIIAIASIAVFSSCHKYNDKLVDINNSFQISMPDSTGIRNDGTSTIKLTVTKLIDLKDNTKVVFEKTKGTIQKEEVSFIGNEAIAYLTVSQDTGIYFISAKIKDGENVKAEKNIVFSFLRAYPDFISIEPDKLVYNFDADKETVLKVYLLRKNGLATTHLPVSFKAYQIGATPTDTLVVGRFKDALNNFSTATGKLEKDVSFFTDTQNIDPTKAIFIEVTSKNDSGNTINTTINLTYK